MESIYREMSIEGLRNALISLNKALDRSWEVDPHERKEYVDDISSDIALVKRIIEEKTPRIPTLAELDELEANDDSNCYSAAANDPAAPEAVVLWRKHCAFKWTNNGCIIWHDSLEYPANYRTPKEALQRLTEIDHGDDPSEKP